MNMELIQTFKKSYYLKMSADKRFIAQANSSQINIFENGTYRHLAQFKEVGNASVFFSDDSSLLLAKDNGRKLVVYDLATMSIRCKLKPKVGSSNGDGDACISYDNKYVINLEYYFPYGYISVYDIENGKETRYCEDMKEVYNQIHYIPSRRLYLIDGFRMLPLNIKLPVKHQQGCLDIQLSHNNKMIAIYQNDNLKLCTFPNMEILTELSNIGYGRVSFSSDDKEILISSTIKGLMYKLE